MKKEKTTEDKIKDLHAYFNKELGSKIEELSAKKTKKYDLSFNLEQINLEILKDIDKFEPFGVGNQKPKFILRNVKKLNAKIIGKKGEHISANFSSKSSIGFNGFIQIVSFRSSETQIGEFLLDNNYKKEVNLVGVIGINSWMGKEKMQMILEDIIL